MKKNHKNKIGVIVQARMGSKRLPGKVLMELYKGERVLDLLIKRLKICKTIDQIIIATTPNKKDIAVINRAKFHKISYFIGSEENVLQRYYKAAKRFKLDLIIRITADCPFVDPRILDEMVQFFLHNNYDYIKNVDGKNNFPIGMDIEIFSFRTLQKVYRIATDNWDKEHVTRYIYDHSKLFSIYIFNKDDLNKIEGVRLTIDEAKDLKFCREVFKRIKIRGKLYKFSIYDIIEILKNEPDLMEINKSVKKKLKNQPNSEIIL